MTTCPAPLSLATSQTCPFPAQAQQARGVGDREGARGGERGVLAERVAGEVGGVAREHQAGLGLERAQGGEARRHERRLRVGGEGQRVRRPLEDGGGQRLAERLVDLGEDGARRGVAFGERPAHADRLAPLPRKDEGPRHAVSSWSARCVVRFVPSGGAVAPPSAPSQALPRQRLARAAGAAERDGRRPFRTEVLFVPVAPCRDRASPFSRATA
jgi:hypothetical protein